MGTGIAAEPGYDASYGVRVHNLGQLFYFYL